MNRKILSVILWVLILSQRLFASNIVSIRTLYEEADMYDGRSVVVIGEAIGDIMRDGSTFWVNVKDGDFFIGVVLNAELKDKIRHTGRYKVQGSIIKVSGIYNLHCRRHLGERDIHADKIEVLREGGNIEKEIEMSKVFMSIILALATIIFVFYPPRRNTRRDNGGQQR